MLKIKIDPRDLAASTKADEERVKALVVSALMIGETGAGAAVRSDQRECVIAMALSCLSADLSPSDGFKERVLAAIDKIEMGRTS